MLGSFRARLRASSIAAAGLLLLLSAVPASAAPTPFNTNLVKNPGAEAGNAGANGTDVVPIPKWTNDNGNGNFTVVKYGTAGGYPTAAEGQRISGGQQFFAAGLGFTHNTCSQLMQRVAIVGRGSLIDSNQVRVQLDAWIATFASQVDSGTVTFDFANANEGFITRETLGPVTKTNGVFQHKSTSRIVPEHTRFIFITLRSLGEHQGAECDAYFDKLSVKISRV